MITNRYRKTLVTVVNGLRDESEIKEGGLYIFRLKDKQELITKVEELFKQNGKCMLLKVNKEDFLHTPRLFITNEKDFQNFKDFYADELLRKYAELWVIEGGASKSWRCRLILSENISLPDTLEIIYCDNDHGLDRYSNNQSEPYARYEKKQYEICFKLVCKENDNGNIEKIGQNILYKLQEFSSKFKKIKEDLVLMQEESISFDFRYFGGKIEWHDWDCADYNKVMEYYLPMGKEDCLGLETV